jgi:hypothetical protein
MEVREVSDAIFATCARKDHRTEYLALQSLQNMTNSITDAPLSTSSISDILKGWAGLESLTNVVCSTGITLRQQRASLMLINYTAFYWLDVFIVDRSKAILEAKEIDEGWLPNLVLDLDLHFKVKDSTPTIFNSQHYWTNLPNMTYILEQGYSRVPRNKDRRDQRVISAVVAILEKWLNYPTDKSARQKAWFVHLLLTEFGRNVLYLNGTWNVYSDLRGRLFTNGAWRLDSFKVIKPIQDSMVLHPLHILASPERQAVDKIANLIEGVGNGGFADKAPVVDEITTFRDTLAPPLRQIADEEMRLFELFVQTNLEYQIDDMPKTHSLPQLAARLRSCPDKYLIFREFAPSRARAKSSNGPFTSDLIRTTVGIFSALIWRGVTFGTEFATEGLMVFQSAEHFDSIKINLDKPETYFCDKGAYGVPNPFRTTALVHHYWNSLQGGVWEAFIGNRKIPFLECWEFFLLGTKPPRFPQLGPLAAYLLTADLVYADVVVGPTVEDMVTVIRELNKGAVAALERLRLITPRPLSKHSKGKCGRDECLQGFRFMVATIQSLLPSPQYSTLSVDLIMAEHALCKFSRCGRNNLLR